MEDDKVACHVSTAANVVSSGPLCDLQNIHGLHVLQLIHVGMLDVRWRQPGGMLYKFGHPARQITHSSRSVRPAKIYIIALAATPSEYISQHDRSQ